MSQPQPPPSSSGTSSSSSPPPSSPPTAAPISSTPGPDMPRSSTLPNPPQARTLVLCFDGTSNQYDGDNTNVVKFYSLLKKDCTDEQLCYYQPGIGTYLQPGVISPMFQWCAKILDEAIAWYLDAHVQGGYQFLMQNWRPGDKICIFGFSRGAYTARALAGMLHKIGLLPKDNPEQIPFAYKLFTKTDTASLTIARGFKETFCRSVVIDFVGVWETVASVGIISGRSLPFTTANQTIKVFRHALSLDEHRARFRPNLYHRPAPDPKSASNDPEHASFAATDVSSVVASSEKSTSKLTAKFKKLIPPTRKKKAKQTANKLGFRGNGRLGITKKGKYVFKDSAGDEIAGGTDVLEVWFAGCHADVGGGSVPDSTVHALSDVTLRWMVRQVVLSQCGITFDQAALLRANIPDSVFTGVGFPVPPSPHPISSGSKPLPPVGPNSNTAGTTNGTTDGEKGDSNTVPGPDGTLKTKGTVGPLDTFVLNKGSLKAKTQSKVVETPIDEDGLTSAASPTAAAKKKEAEEDSDDKSSDNDSTTTQPDIDALQPIYDQLKIDPLWWLLEIIPLTYSYQDGKGVWHKKLSIHFGRARHIPDIKPNFHVSVKERINDAELKYKPRAVWKTGTESYVE
ncbi:hypothetical protein ABKN59_005360 [Abortiporus biennis]